MEKETTYTITTTDRREATIMINATKLAVALHDLMDYRRAIYNGKEYDVSYLYDGKLYTSKEYFYLERDYEKDKLEGKSSKVVITEQQLLDKLDYILDGVEELVSSFME